MWTNLQFWKDSTWRAFRTLCQSLAGLLTVEHISSAFDAPWLDLLGASAIAGLISLLQSVDRERAVTGSVATDPPAPTVDDLPAPVAFLASPASPPGGCGTDLR
jgi:hypothetical protein